MTAMELYFVEMASVRFSRQLRALSYGLNLQAFLCRNLLKLVDHVLRHEYRELYWQLGSTGSNSMPSWINRVDRKIVAG
jgi:hypothetical protein